MKSIDYKVTYAEGDEEVVHTRARDINSGFGKALKQARVPLGNGRRREISRIEFWEVVS